MSADVGDNSKKLSEIDVVSSLNDDDVFVFERNNISYKMSYADFRRHVIECMLSQLSIGSAASCDGSEFAPFAHTHDYTDLSFFPSYGKDSPEPVLPSTDSYTIGYFDTIKYLPGYNEKKTSRISVDVPLRREYFDNQLTSYERHSIGDLLLVNTGKITLYEYLREIYGAELTTYNGLSNVNINKISATNGFVIPNGTTFTCNSSEFKDACAAFSTDKQSTATSFTVPVIDSFFKFNPGLRNTDPTEKI